MTLRSLTECRVFNDDAVHMEKNNGQHTQDHSEQTFDTWSI